MVLSGCGKAKLPGLVQCEGVVTYKGEPVDGAVLNFQPTSGGRTAYATADASGKFKVTTIDPNDGILKGQYKVNVQKYIITGYVKNSEGEEDPLSKNVLPDKYASDKTPLTLDVTAKKLDVKFELVD